MKKFFIGIFLSTVITVFCLQILNQNLYKQYESFLISNTDSFEMFYHKELLQKSISDKKILFECNEKFAKTYENFQMGEIQFIMNFSPDWKLISFWGEALKSEQVVEKLRQKFPDLFVNKRFTALWSSGDLAFQLIHPYSQFRYSVIGIRSPKFWQYRSEFFLLSSLVGILFGCFYFFIWSTFFWLNKKPRLYNISNTKKSSIPSHESNIKIEDTSTNYRFPIRKFTVIEKSTQAAQQYQSEIFLYRSLTRIPKEISGDSKSYCQYIARIFCELLFPEKYWILQIFLPSPQQKSLLQCVLSTQQNKSLKNEIFLTKGEEGSLLNVLSPYRDPQFLYTTMSGMISRKKKMAIRITNLKNESLNEQKDYLFIQSTIQCAKIFSKNVEKETKEEQLLLEINKERLPELDSNQRPSG